MSVRHVVIRGIVQGVGYRAWAEDAALQLRLAEVRPDQE